MHVDACSHDRVRKVSHAVLRSMGKARFDKEAELPSSAVVPAAAFQGLASGLSRTSRNMSARPRTPLEEPESPQDHPWLERSPGSAKGEREREGREERRASKAVARLSA